MVRHLQPAIRLGVSPAEEVVWVLIFRSFGTIAYDFFLMRSELLIYHIRQVNNKQQHVSYYNTTDRRRHNQRAAAISNEQQQQTK